MRFSLLAIGFLAASLSGAAWAGDAGVYGLWNVQDDSAQVRIAPCGDKVCGKLAWIEEPLDEHGLPQRDKHNPKAELRDRRILGLKIVWGMRRNPEEPAEWSGGRVYDPDNGKTYQATMILTGRDQLELRGYVGMPLFGRTATWTRAAVARSRQGE